MLLEALRETVAHSPLLLTGILLLFGYALGRLAERLGLPAITGFVIAGLFLGDSALGLVSEDAGEGLSIITKIALGLIALTIGGEFYWVKLKRSGAAIAVITLVQILASFGLAAGSLVLAGMAVPIALILGAIATATEPAATIAIVQGLRARGPFVDYLYGIVALDDAGAVIAFGVVFAVVSGLLGVAGGSAALGPGAAVLGAVGEVLFSVLLGAVTGLVIHLIVRRLRSTGEIVLISLGTLFVATALADVLHLSELLANMAAGAVIINLNPRNHRIFEALRPLTPPIYALFFVIAGTQLQVGALLGGEALLFGSVYLVGRALGKYGGIFLGASLMKSDRGIRDWLGLCMFPQAGVAIGLVLVIEASPIAASLGPQGPQIVDTMINVILFSVFVNALIGPPLSKLAVVRGTGMNR